MIIVRYADDLIVGFEHEADARRFLDEMRKRLQEFVLSLHSEKTRLIEFGRFAVENRKRRGLGKPENLHLPGLHLYLQQNSTGQIPNQTEVPAGSHAGKVASYQAGTATEHASADSPAGEMVAAGRHRLLQLPRGADKPFVTDRVPIPRHQSLAAHATVAEPKRWDDLGADQAVGRRLAPETANPSSVARESLRRQTPKVGAVCPNWARTDLCGGRGTTRVPTAKVWFRGRQDRF